MIRLLTRIYPLFFTAFVIFGCAAGSKELKEPPKLVKRADHAALTGMEAYALGDYADALASFTEALRVDRSIDDRAAETMDLINIGRVLIVLGDHDGAVDRLHEAVTVATGTGDKAGLVSALSTLAKAAYIAGDNPGALKYLEKSLLMGGVKGAETGAILNLQALVYMDGDKVSEAGKIFASALDLNKRRGDALETANSHRGLAKVSISKGDSAAALYNYMAAYELNRALADPARISADLNSMAELHLKEGRLEEAVFLYERSYMVNSNSGRLAGARADVENLLKSYRKLGDETKVLYWDKVLRKDID